MFMDIGAGLIIAVIINLFFEPTNPNVYIVLFGPLTALAPDIDFLVYASKKDFKQDRWTYRHRYLLHHPIPFVLAGVVILFPINQLFALAWLCCTIYHFAHDTFNAFGIPWLSPFSEIIRDLSDE